MMPYKDDGKRWDTADFKVGMRVTCTTTGEQGVVARITPKLVWVRVGEFEVGWRPQDLRESE